MDSYTIPFLNPGDKVAVIATAKNFSIPDLNNGIKVLESWGLKVIRGKNLKKKFHQFAGIDAERLSDLQEMLDHPEIKAIFFARGGYGTSRIIDEVSLTNFRKHPKWAIGFSDLTVIHCQLQKNYYPSIHGPMPMTFLKPGGEKALEALKETLFGKSEEYKVKKHKLNRIGKAEGEIIGGNLSIINTIIGTSSDFDFKNKILFLEDIGEYLYHIDRMMIHLKRAGKLEQLAGLIIGQFSDMKDNDTPFGKSLEGIIMDAVKNYEFPVCFNFPAGHEANNMPLIFGQKAILEVGEKSSTLKYKVPFTK